MNTPGFGKLLPMAIGTALALASPTVFGQGFEEADVFFELNDTDGDLGFHGLIDGDAWKTLEIEGPGETELMNVWIRNNLRKQGLTEIFFESDEPPFDELSPATFLNRFPAGKYEIEAVTLDDEEIEAVANLSHVLAARPGNIKVNGQNSAVNCDAANLPVVSEPVTLDWNAVTKSHPTIGTTNVNVNVQQYEVVGEIERENKTPEVLVFSVILPKTVTEFEFPEGFTALAEDEVKFEIITKLANGNQTAVESCFEIE